MSTTRIDIYSPGVGNTLGGFASHWHLFARCRQHARGLRLTLTSILPVLATRSGATPYAVNLSSLLHHRRCSVCYVDFSSAYFSSSMTSPTASIRQHHHHDLATVRLHRPRHARASFGALTRDIQDYDVKENLGLESLS
jgi:hypothetical protein